MQKDTQERKIKQVCFVGSAAKIQFVITDIDGTIIDRMPILRKTFAEMLFRYHGIPQDFSGQYYYDTAGITLAGPNGQLAGILRIYNISFTPEYLEEFVREFIALSHKTKPGLFPGVKEVLDQIKKADKHLLASSGSPTPELSMLFAKHSLPYDFFLGSDVVRKGDEHIQMLADHFGFLKAEFCEKSLYVGDGPADMELGKRNGIFTLGITTTVSAEKLTAAGADAIITDIRDLLDYLQ